MYESRTGIRRYECQTQSPMVVFVLTLFLLLEGVHLWELRLCKTISTDLQEETGSGKFGKPGYFCLLPFSPYDMLNLSTKSRKRLSLLHVLGAYNV